METITHTSFVYKWTHLPTGKWYIGSRTAKGCHPEDGYISSSQIIIPLIKQNPKEWYREIIEIGEPTEMVKLETTLLESLDAKNNPMSFNQHDGDGKFTRTGVTVLRTSLAVLEVGSAAAFRILSLNSSQDET